ncbi:hypothetical protein SRHO_G00199940 [Serrasalmus rhombeus]
MSCLQYSAFATRVIVDGNARRTTSKAKQAELHRGEADFPQPGYWESERSVGILLRVGFKVSLKRTEDLPRGRLAVTFM